MGTVNTLVALRAIQKSKNAALTSFACNYNDVESKKCAVECLELLLQMTNIKTIDFIGNLQSKKLCREWSDKFIGRTINLVPEDEPIDEEDEEEDEENDDVD